MRTLYPELTDDEYVQTIRPLRRRRITPSSGTGIGESAGVAGGLGADHEVVTFQAVCAAIARHYWRTTWTPGGEHQLRDAEQFAEAQIQRLSIEVFNMAIRPLADAMREFGETRAASYEQFCETLLRSGFTDFAAAYPVLWGRLELRLERKVGALLELLNRLQADRADIERRIGIPRAAAVTAVQDSGDTHGGGRTVSIVTFDTGANLVYKPRPVDCEAAWSRLAEWMRRRYDLRLHGLTVLDRATYGYVKFVDRHEAADRDFTEVGQLAAVLYLLKARDMHFSNIRHTAAGPVAIDLETLLHPPRQKSTGLQETPRSAYRLLGESVYGTGILPLVVSKRGEHGGVDIGFAGGGEVYGRSPFRRFRLENEFSADLRVVWDRDRDGDELAPAPAISEDDARAVNRRCAEMVEGFQLAYRAIAADVEAFAAQVRDEFGGCRVRYIHNPTVRYEQALRSLTGTEASANGELADGLLKRVAIASPSAARELVESECRQLWETDVPYFLLRADGTDITGTDGRPIVRNAVALSPLAEVQRGLASLSEEDLDRQLRLIRMAFNAKLPDPHVMDEVVELRRAGAAAAHAAAGAADDSGRLRDLAADLADSLVDAMVEDRYPHLPRTWIGPVATAEANRPWSPGVLSYDLYTGRVGPALALAALGTTLPSARYTDAAEAVFTPIAQILNERTFETRSITQAGIGAYNGFAGTAWALAVAARLLDRRDYADAAQAATAFLTGEAAGRGWFDSISGGIGAELVLLEIAPDAPALRERIDRSCRYALDHRLADGMEYSGLAHGVAGLIRYAARAFRGTGLSSAQELCETARAALQRRFFVSEARGFRTNASGEENHSDSWCNGSVGLMLAIAEAITCGLASTAELDDLVARLRRDPVSRNLTLCHGILGLREATAWMARRLGPCDVIDALDRDLLGYLDADVIAAGAYDADSRYSQSTSLMAGRSGVVLHLRNRLQADSLVAPLTLDLEAV